jgi:uncharacterized protein YndB with AHSA1/START domain
MIERQVTLPACRQEVWEALTEPDRLRAWFGAWVDWDLRPGGAARFRDDDGSERSGVIETVTDREVLRFRWWSDDDREPESEVTYTLEEVPDGTRLTVTERPSGEPEPPTACARTDGSGFASWDLRLIGLWLQAVARVPATV